MNKERRSKIYELVERLGRIRGDIEGILDEETKYRDNIPGTEQQSKEFENAEKNCHNLESAYDSVDDAVRHIWVAHS